MMIYDFVGLKLEIINVLFNVNKLFVDVSDDYKYVVVLYKYVGLNIWECKLLNYWLVVVFELFFLGLCMGYKNFIYF